MQIEWARLPERVHPNQWAKRLRIARGFAGYLQTIDPATEIPAPDVFPTRKRRATPYLFSEQDICRLLAETRRLSRPLRAASYEALLGLLAVSGMRVGEAIALRREDILGVVSSSLRWGRMILASSVARSASNSLPRKFLSPIRVRNWPGARRQRATSCRQTSFSSTFAEVSAIARGVPSIANSVWSLNP